VSRAQRHTLLRSPYEDGPESDVVFSSRVRLARNIAGLPFPGRAGRDELRALVEHLRPIFDNRNLEPALTFVEVRALSALERRVMVEAHLASPALVERRAESAVAFSADGRLSVMVNEEDHLRIQAIRPGLETWPAWQAADALDEWLCAQLPFAYRPDLGYLTAHISNLGTGMRASVMLHLPALKACGRLPAVLEAAARLGAAVRGAHGEDTASSGDLYQVSNRYGMGKAEREIVTEVHAAASHLVAEERSARQELLRARRTQVEDDAWRAYGILRYARSISTEEALDLLSKLMLGRALGLVALDASKLKHLMVMAQPGCLQTIVGPAYSPAERDAKRADFLRLALSSRELRLGN
jgi:protein arginine kinase